jgi:hypothetical protein
VSQSSLFNAKKEFLENFLFVEDFNATIRHEFDLSFMGGGQYVTVRVMTHPTVRRISVF